MICKKCGYENAESNNFCEGCGISLKVPVEITEPKIEVLSEMDVTSKINNYEDLQRKEKQIISIKDNDNQIRNNTENLKELLLEFIEIYTLNENGRSMLKEILEVSYEISEDRLNFTEVLEEIFAEHLENIDNQNSKPTQDEIDKEEILVDSLVIPEIDCVTIEMNEYQEAVGKEQCIEVQPKLNMSERQTDLITKDEISKSQNEDMTLKERIPEEIKKNNFQNSKAQKKECPVFHPIKVEGEMLDIPVTKTPFIIGRGPNNVDFILKAAGISRKHCLITFHNDSFHISDLGSTNKVFLNNQMLNPGINYKVKNGDKVNFGINQYCFELVE